MILTTCCYFLFYLQSSVTPKENSPAPPPAAQPTPAAGRPEAKEEAIKETEEVGAEHLIKHPLHNTWTLWYLENDRTKSWEDMQNEITSFDTVEDFWW